MSMVNFALISYISHYVAFFALAISLSFLRIHCLRRIHCYKNVLHEVKFFIYCIVLTFSRMLIFKFLQSNFLCCSLIFLKSFSIYVCCIAPKSMEYVVIPWINSYSLSMVTFLLCTNNEHKH